MNAQPSTVLIVDDEERILSALRRRLASSFPVLTRKNGQAGLKAILEHPEIAVVVADMRMPVMDGLTFLKEVKAKRPDIRRLMLTGNADQETAISAINDGQVMRFLRKPCDSEELTKSIQQALDEYHFRMTQITQHQRDSLAAERGRQSRDAFLSMMGDELRTPLSHIVSLSELLRDPSMTPDNPHFSSFIDKMQDSGDRVLKLVNRILEFSRLKSVSSDTDFAEHFDLCRIIENEVEKFRTRAEQKGVTISLDIPSGPIEVRAHEGEVCRAISELMSNAVKFNSQHGHISIAMATGAGFISLRVANTGVAVPGNLSQSELEPFNQADQGSTRQFKGIGLGLALVSTIAERNNAIFEIGAQDNGGAVAVLNFFSIASSPELQEAS